ncbi:MAG: CBS domain-containing protein [Gammaproteobacteria bacterium]
MTTRLQTVEPQTPIEDLFGIYEQGRVPIVVEEQKFLGLITRIDLLNYLRRRMK